VNQKSTKNDIFLGSNSETIEGMDLKLMMLYYLFRHYAQTKFHSILKGSRFFLCWFDMEWPTTKCVHYICTDGQGQPI